MTIGHHELSICRASRRLSSKSFRFPPTSFIAPGLRQRRAMTSRYDPDGVLWRRNLGIRFSPKPQAKTMYPQLDMPRYVHDSPGAANPEPDSPEPQVGQQSASDVDTAESAPSASDSSFRPSQSTDEVEAQDILEHDIADSQPSEAEPQATPVEPPSTSLRYQISPELFHKARASPSGTSDSYWSHLMYRNTDKDSPAQNVKVHYCFSKKTMEWVCQKYFVGEPILGFDLEWLPWSTSKGTARQNVSLIQLASPSRIALFHCSLFGKDDFIGDTFRTIMGDSNVSKVGVAVKADCTRLEKWMGVKTKGILELSHLHKIVKYTKEGRPDLIKKSLVPLASLVQEYLGLPLYKGDSVRSSDWTKILTSKQITYSAADAYAGLQLYHVIDEARQKMDPCPARPHFAELSLPLPIPLFPAKDIEEVAAIAAAYEESAAAAAQVETSTTTAPTTPSKPPVKDTPVATTTPSITTKDRDERITAADLQTQKYRLAKGRPCAVGPSALRAYYIWHNNADLKPEAIAKLLREPPLQTNTVVGYVLSSVTTESLPYDKDRMKDELLAVLAPEALKSSRYQALLKDCGMSGCEILEPSGI